jgi:hypothetical protein
MKALVKYLPKDVWGEGWRGESGEGWRVVLGACQNPQSPIYSGGVYPDCAITGAI